MGASLWAGRMRTGPTARAASRRRSTRNSTTTAASRHRDFTWGQWSGEYHDEGGIRLPCFSSSNYETFHESYKQPYIFPFQILTVITNYFQRVRVQDLQYIRTSLSHCAE